MNKVGIVISVLAVFYIAGLLICKIMIPDNNGSEVDDDISTTKLVESELGYTKHDSGNYFETYVIDKDNIEDIDIMFNKTKIKYIGNKIYINDKNIIEDVTINRNFALYSDLVLVIGFNYNDFLYSGFIMYDIFEEEYEIVNKINGRFIDDEYSFSDTGILLTTKLVQDNYFLLNDSKKNICDYKLTHDIPVITSTMYIYDMNEKVFDDFEEISSISLESYVVSNKLCEKST